MGNFKPKENSNIVELTCTNCQINTIYLKVKDYKSNIEPFKATQFICTECNQGLMQNLTTA